ncbi:hypothetical protein [Rhodobacter capsulatus]|uniref:hypothetical protein n=1 Tax=Rhodobacter capsulatus TaxID=1061 RepID=UPI0040295F12
MSCIPRFWTRRARSTARSSTGPGGGWAGPSPEPKAKSGTGIRSEADLLRFSAEDLAKVSAHAAGFGVSAADLSPDPEAVAAVLCRIRQTCQ